MTGRPSDGAERLERHHRDMLELVGTAERLHERGRSAAAAAYAQVAGRHAWLNHTGAFASPRLEALLGRIGAELPAADRAARPVRDPRTILHVLTQAYGTGGSTREVECWVQQDRDRRHRVCITRQGATPPPASLAGLLDAPGDLVRLDTGPGGLPARAARLRALAAECDLVLLHVHPYDVVPAIAFARGSGAPPVVLVNHADHVFWLGTSVATVLMNMRESGRALAAARRGCEPARSVVAPRPLVPESRGVDRAEARRRLGLDPGRVLLVTAADASKYRAVGDPGFLDLVVPVLERHPEAELVAAGPAPEGEWADAAERTGGRVRALGRLPDVTLLQQAADVYLDSFPFSSLTSLLEAGAFATPAITYRGHPGDCLVLGADTPGVDEHVLRPATPAEFAEQLARAIADGEWRRELGARTEAAIRATHTGAGWRAAMADVYARAAELDGAPAPGPAPRRADPVDVLVDRVMERTGHSTGAAGALRDNLGLMPAGRRLAAWAALARAGALPPLRNALPEWTLPHLGGWRRRALALTRPRWKQPAPGDVRVV